MKRALFLWLLAGLLSASAATAQGLVPLREGARVAFLGITFIDTSTEGAYNPVRSDETARLALVRDYVEARFTEDGFVLIDLAPISTDLAAVTNPADCYGCETRLAARLNADYVLVGEVQRFRT